MNGEFITHDAGAIGACLRKLLARPDLVRAMGENARRLVETTYTWDRVTLMTEEAYAESVELRKQGP